MKKFTKKLSFFIVLFTTISTITLAQEKEKPFGISFYGYVKNDFFYDSRQTVDAREGHLLMWPKAPSYDANNVDINAHGSFNFLAIQTRLGGKISGPDILGAKSSALFEGEFFGHTDADINGFRLRHAIIKLNWTRSEIMTGQFWHPMFTLECFPGTVSFNTGLGFAPFSRNPQIKYTYTAGKVKLMFAAYGERDFTSRNIAGVPSSAYIRNSGTPGINFHLDYGNTNVEKERALNTGFVANYISIQPELTTAAGYQTNQLVHALAGLVYVNAKFKPINIKFAGVYAENGAGITIPGGYAVLDVLDPTTLECKYIPTRAASAWIDISSTGKTWKYGIFAGYTHNLGTSKDIDDIGLFGGLGTNLHHLYRISPRINYYSGKFQIGAEIEYTTAAYGDGTYTLRTIANNPEEVSNVRFIIGVFYNF